MAKAARALVFGVVALAVLATACANKPKSVFSEVPVHARTTVTSAPGPTTTLATLPSPLTGEQVTPAVARRAVVIVKVDNSPQARPQAGLNAADVVYEERVEGSVVRFLTLFQSGDANLVGPVRSVRSTDAAVLAPLGGIFAFSGGIRPFIDKVEAEGVKTITEGDTSSPVFERAGKARPYATYADTRRLRPLAGSTTPPPLFARLSSGTAFADGNGGASPITGLRVVFGSLTTADWTWDPGQRLWLRSTNNTSHVLQDGSRLSTQCLIQQTVPYRATQYSDRSGAGVDEAVVTGSGDAVVACDGQVVQARFSKASSKSVTTYTNATTGAPIKLPVGRVWVSLVPTNGIITLKRATDATTTTR